MGIYDRKWYADAVRQKELHAQRTQNPDPMRTSPEQPRKPQAHWTIMLMLWVALLLIGTIVARLLR